MQTLNSLTIMNFWHCNGDLQFTSGEQRFAPESRSRSELSVQSQCRICIAIMTHTLNSTTVSHIWLPHWGLQLGGPKIRARIALSLGAVPPKSMVNPHCNRHAHAEFDYSITHLAPPWGSVVHFGGPKIRARIALSLGAVLPKSMLNPHCNRHAHDEFE